MWCVGITDTSMSNFARSSWANMKGHVFVGSRQVGE